MLLVLLSSSEKDAALNEVKPEKPTKITGTENTSSVKVVALEKCYSKRGAVSRY